MKATPLKNNNNETQFKVIRNSANNFKQAIERIYINTLTPGFEYKNAEGELVNPHNCILL